jgi:formamidopyrimidine-DNA glycosylase
MPELPEVETIVQALRRGGRDGLPVTGQTLAGVRVLWARTIAVPALLEFQKRIPGQVVKDVYRRGKFVCLQLTQDVLLVHLRMSGDLRVEGPVSGGQALPLQPHDRVVFEFEAGLRLAFNDARKFGRIWLTADSQTVTGKLGPEPLSPDFTWEELYRRLHASGRRLKPLLLDQSFLAGLGNIYTDEALFAAGLHPSLAANILSEEQAERLWTAIRAVLQEGILRNGASIDWVYRGGNFQNHFRVYQRTGQPCLVCGSPIQRMVIGQRGTHFCPVCQPKG